MSFVRLPGTPKEVVAFKGARPVTAGTAGAVYCADNNCWWGPTIDPNQIYIDYPVSISREEMAQIMADIYRKWGPKKETKNVKSTRKK